MSCALHDAQKSGLLREGVTPYSNIEPVAAAKEVIAGRYVFPYVGELPVWRQGHIIWQPQFDSNHASKALWFYSLVFIDYLLKAAVIEADQQYWHKAVALYDSYRQWREQEPASYLLLFKDEHAVTNRACVLSQFLHCALQRNEAADLSQVLMSELAEHADWLIDEQNYVFNNHGIMMDRALLNLVVQFRQQAAELFQRKTATWLDTALGRLKLMLNRTFDKDGCCTENSPSYHMLNLSLFGAINSFINKHHLAAADHAITAVLKKAITAAAYQVYEDGSLPLLGDSEEKASVFLPEEYHKDKFGIGFYPDAGFCLIKQPGFHFTFKCGGSSFSHRHIDDTSITLRVAGLDFICDGGMYSYDNSNAVRKFLTSYRAHSGFFTENCANVRYANYAAPSDLAKICWTKSSEDLVQIEGESQLDLTALIKRRVSLLGGKQQHTYDVLLSDTLRSEQPKKWRQQFLLHPEVELSLGESQAILSRADIRLAISVNSTEAFTLHAEDGFFSERYQQYQHCKVLVVSGSACNVDIATLITVNKGL